jgi:uncharacterized protein YbjQ (UPF0145 family)
MDQEIEVQEQKQDASNSDTIAKLRLDFENLKANEIVSMQSRISQLEKAVAELQG